MIPEFALILLLSIICDARIKINITVASNKNDTIIKFNGEHTKLITDREIGLFNVSLANLNRGVRVELGRVPDGIYLKDPTPYGNLFKKYKWPEVRTRFSVDKVTVYAVSTADVLLTTLELTNNSTGDVPAQRSLFSHIEADVYSTWSKYGFPEENFDYDVNFKLHDSYFKYKNKWRDESGKSEYVPFGANHKRVLIVKPGKGLIKKLTAKRTLFILHVDYKSQLVGNIITDYERLYGKYHFYSPAINNIMKAANISNGIRTREEIVLRCYTDPKLDIYDRDTGVKLLDWGRPTSKHSRN